MKKLQLLFACLIAMCHIGYSQTQIGQDIPVCNQCKYQKTAIAINSNGNRLAVGNPSNGTVKSFYLYEGKNWGQIGMDIKAATDGDNTGMAVDLDKDGNLLVIGSPAHGKNSGLVRVYAFDGNAWSMFKNEINGDLPGGEFGHAVAISKDGNRLAVGAPGSGIVRAYNLYKNNYWGQIGKDLKTGNKDDRFGTTIAITDDGNIMAVGMPGANKGRGQVQVYKFNGTDWTESANVLEGAAAGGNFGQSISINADGSRLVVGSNTSGVVQVFHLYKANQWGQIGKDINISASKMDGGNFLDLDADGNRLVVSNPGGGKVWIYQFDGTNWNQLGREIESDTKSGNPIALTPDGNTLVLGSPERGNFRVLDLRRAQANKAQMNKKTSQK